MAQSETQAPGASAAIPCTSRGPRNIQAPGSGGEYQSLICELRAGHSGAHAMGEATWSSAPALGPVPDQFRRQAGIPLGPLDELDGPNAVEVIAAELVKCGRVIGRAETEELVRRRWKAIIRRSFALMPSETECRPPSEEQWAALGRYLYDFGKDEAAFTQTHNGVEAQEHAAGILAVLLGKLKPRRVSPLDAAAAAVRIGRTFVRSVRQAGRHAYELETGRRRPKGGR